MSNAAVERKIDAERIVLSEYVTRQWTATFWAGSEPADTVMPETWQPIGEQMDMHKWDKIECREELGAWWVWLIVLSDGAHHVEPLATKRFTPPQQTVVDAGAYEIVDKGVLLKWCVREKGTTGRQLTDRKSSEESARHWLTEHLKSLKA